VKTKTPIEIDLFEFIKSGKFDYIELGQTKERISANFYKPDDIGCDGKIWAYGDIEFHFDGDELFMIFTDNFNSIATDRRISHKIDGGKNLNLRKWIFEQPHKLNFIYIIKHLLAHGIDYSIKHKKRFNTIELTVIQSGVKLHFEAINENENDPKKYKCAALWLTRKD
jgi:hypothetical protein